MNPLDHLIKLLVALTLCLLPLKAHGADQQDGNLVYTEYKNEDHGGGSFSTKIAEDENGIIFVGNESGLLRFDGEKWITMPPTGYETYTSSVAIDTNGNVWCTGPRYIGFYEQTPKGFYIFNDLTPSLLKAEKTSNAEFFWDIFVGEEEVYLISSDQVSIWKDETWTKWKFKEMRRILPSFVDGKLYIYARGTGLFKVNERESVKIAHETKSVESGVISILKQKDGQLIYITISDGIFKLKNGIFKQISKNVSGDNIISAETLNNQKVVVGSANQVIAILDASGERDRIIVNQSESCYDLFQHSSGEIWAATTQRILRIQPNAISKYSETASDLARFNNKILLTNNNELKELSLTHSASKPYSEFETLYETHALWDICIKDNDLLFGDNYSLNSLSPNGSITKEIHNRQVMQIYYSWQNSNLIYTSDPPTISRWQKEQSTWKYIDSLDDFSATALSMTELPNNEVLIAASNSPLQSVDWPTHKKNKPTFRTLGKESGLPEKFIWAHCLRLKETVIIISDKGLYRYDKKTDKFHYNNLLGNDLGNDSFGFESCPLANKNGWILRIAKFPHGNQNENKIGQLTINNDNTLEWKELQLPLLSNVGKIEALLHEIDGYSERLWVGGSKNTCRYDLSALKETTPPKVIFTSIRETNTHQTHFGGAGLPEQNPEWTFPQKTLHFEFASPPQSINLEGYQSRLVGFDDEWSETNELSFRDFTNLSEGDYIFEVRAIDEFQRTGEAAQFHFTLLPPWFRTAYAYTGYTFLIGFIGFGIFKWRTNQLKNQNLELEKAVNERTTELNRQKIELIKANSVKENFLASMSHEIRNPLNGIIGITQLMKQKKFEDEQDRIQAAHLFSCANHLHQLLGQILEYSSLEAGKITPESKNFNPLDIIKDVIDMYRILADEQGLDLTHDEFAPEYEWIGDPILLRQILINLVSNAIKYTPTGSVHLGIEYEIADFSIAAKFEVIDTGPGIPEDKRSFIFEKFTRIKGPGEDEVSGTGLGLAIVSDLAKLINGNIQLDENYSNGAKFQLNVDFDQGPVIRNNKSLKTQKPDTLLEGKKVLVADDMEFNRYVCSEVLQRMGANIEMAEDGIQAIRKLKFGVYDIAILDINMPGASGLEVVQLVKENSTGPVPLFIALSAHSAIDMKKQCIDIGFDDFVVKPLDSNKLKEILGKAKTPDTVEEEASLIDDLFAGDQNKKIEVSAKLAKTFLDELEQLEEAIQAEDDKQCEFYLHRLTGLNAFYKDPNINSLLDEITPMARKRESIEYYIKEFQNAQT